MCLLPLPAPPLRCLGTATLHPRRPWDPEPVGRGLMGPPPWWDLSPTLAMRLQLLASLSGGGLAWRAGDHRWLAGESWDWWAWGQPGLGVGSGFWGGVRRAASSGEGLLGSGSLPFRTGKPEVGAVGLV